MRTLSSSQQALLESAAYEIHARLEVEDSTGGFGVIDGSWLESMRWSWDIDQPVGQMLIDIRRDDGQSTGKSFAPLDEESTFNVNSTAGYAPLLDAGREIRVYTAVRELGSAAPNTSEYDYVFNGEIDRVAWPQSPLQITARSKLLASANDRWIETTTVYGASSGDAVENVIQDLLDDWTDLGTTLLVSSSPGFVVTKYEQQQQSVLQAMTVLSQLIGWDIREVYDEASSAWRLEFSEPNRTATSSDISYTFDASLYRDVRQMEIDRLDVRNYISVLYGPASSRGEVTADSTDSIAKYGRRWAQVQEADDSPISTSSEAQTLADAMLSDLKDPIAEQEIELPYWWPAEIGDYYGFLGNDIHYSTDQYFAVTSIRHDLRKDQQRTSIRVRGKPAGQYLRWRNYETLSPENLPEITNISISIGVDSEILVSVIGDDVTENIYVTAGDGSSPSDPTTSAYDATVAGRNGTAATGIYNTNAQTAYVKAVAANSLGSLGPVQAADFVRTVGPYANDDSTGRTTQATTEATLATVTIPGGSLGTRGGLRVNAKWLHFTNDVDATYYIRVGGTVVASFNMQSTYGVNYWTESLMLYNQTSSGGTFLTSYNNYSYYDGANFQVSVGNQTPITKDMSTDQDVTFTAAAGSSGDTIQLLLSLVEYIGST